MELRKRINNLDTCRQTGRLDTKYLILDTQIYKKKSKKMRRIFLITIAVLFTINVWGQTADKILVNDTRDVNDAPDQFDMEVVFEFKRRSALGIPGSGAYSGMMTFAPWKDNSGDASHQLNFNEGGVFYRTGQPSNTSWDNWREILTTDENGNFGIGTTSPAKKLHVYSDGVMAKFESATSTSYAEIHMVPSDGGSTAIGAVGPSYTHADWANSAYFPTEPWRASESLHVRLQR